MKKITLLAVAALAISFASCKKDRTCSCTTTVTPASGPAYSSSEDITVKKAKKKDAINGQCRSYSYQVTAPVSGTKTDVACTLK